MNTRIIPGVVCVVALVMVEARPIVRDAAPSVNTAADVAAGIDETLTRDDTGCAGVRSTVWHPLSGIEYTGRLRIRLPARLGGAIVLFVGDSIPLDLGAESPDGRPIPLHKERLPSGPGVHVPPDFWLDDNTPWSAPREITRASIEALRHRDRDVVLSLGRRAPRVLARLEGYAADVRVPVCADRVAADDVYYATGWYGQESDDAGSLRWMREHGAVLVGSAAGRAVTVRIRAAPAVPPGEDQQTVLTLQVNHVFETSPVAMRAGFADYEWSVPDPAWVVGTNELFLTVSRTITRGTRTLGLALASVTAR